MLKGNAIVNNNTFKSKDLNKTSILVQILFKSVMEYVRSWHLIFWNEVTFGRHFEYLIKNCKNQNIAYILYFNINTKLIANQEKKTLKLKFTGK